MFVGCSPRLHRVIELEYFKWCSRGLHPTKKGKHDIRSEFQNKPY